MNDTLSALKAKIAQTKRQATGSTTILPDHEQRYKPFPLNDMQRAYWLGRGSGVDGGDIGMQCLMEFAVSDFDVIRFAEALTLLIERHDMLRVVVLPDGMQQVLETPPAVSVGEDDLSGLDDRAQKQRIKETSAAMWLRAGDPSRWPQHSFHFFTTDRKGTGTLLIKLDMWCLDGRSVQIFLEDLVALYRAPHIPLRPLEIRFRDYLLAANEEENSEKFQRDLAYWKERLKTLPPAPGLPRSTAGVGKKSSSIPTDTFFSRKHDLSVRQTTNILNHCRKYGVSLASFAASVYSDILSLWSGQDRFTLNFPRFNRNLDWHPDVTHMIGEFASFSLLEVDRKSGLVFWERTRALQAQMWDDMEHGRVSGVRLLRERILETGQAEMQAMPVVFTAMPDRRSRQGELEDSLAALGKVVSSKGATPQIWLDCQYFLLSDRLQIKWDSRDYEFPAGLIEDMFAEYVRVLELLAEEESWREEHLARIPEQQASVRSAQNNVSQLLAGGTVFDLFANQVEAQRDAPAVVAEDTTLTYGELHSFALSVAGALHAVSVQHPQDGSTQRVAILLERGWRQVASVMGIVAAGMTYIPLDPETPLERLRTICSAAKPLVVITEPSLEPLCRDAGVGAVLFDEIAQSSPLPVPSRPHQQANAPAYLIFTSGSTGVPKGVTIGHESLLNAIQFSNELFTLSPEDAVFGITALHHDLSVYDIFGTLCAGAKLVLPSRKEAYLPEQWLRLLCREGVTFWNSVPMFMEQLLSHCAEQRHSLLLKVVVLGGDWVDPGIAGRLAGVAAQASLFTVGGPTETTLWNIINRVESLGEDWDTLPYGRPIPGASYHILSENMQDAPDWVCGEMYCGGQTLCLSASLNSEENAKAFAVHPQTGERMYRTGDMGRYRPGGLIEILGRRDFQLNINGYRLDPGEVEQTLAKHPEVQRVVAVASAVARTDRRPMEALVAFILPNEGTDTGALERDLRQWSNTHLPAPMRPRRVLFVNTLPLTGNGKVDRKALVAMAAQSAPSAEEEQRPPKNVMEIFLAELWQEVLNATVPGVRSSFFELGGDSLQAMRVFSRVEKRLGIALPLSQIFTTPTIEGLADTVLARIASMTGQAPDAESTEGSTPMVGNA